MLYASKSRATIARKAYYYILTTVLLLGLGCKSLQKQSSTSKDISDTEQVTNNHDGTFHVFCAEGKFHRGKKVVDVTKAELAHVCEDIQGSNPPTTTLGFETCPNLPIPLRTLNLSLDNALQTQLAGLSLAVAKQTLCVGIANGLVQLFSDNRTIEVLKGTDTGNAVLVVVSIKSAQVNLDRVNFVLTVPSEFSPEAKDALLTTLIGKPAPILSVCNDESKLYKCIEPGRYTDANGRSLDIQATMQDGVTATVQINGSTFSCKDGQCCDTKRCDENGTSLILNGASLIHTSRSSTQTPGSFGGWIVATKERSSTYSLDGSTPSSSQFFPIAQGKYRVMPDGSNIKYAQCQMQITVFPASAKKMGFVKISDLANCPDRSELNGYGLFPSMTLSCFKSSCYSQHFADNGDAYAAISNFTAGKFDLEFGANRITNLKRTLKLERAP